LQDQGRRICFQDTVRPGTDRLHLPPRSGLLPIPAYYVTLYFILQQRIIYLPYLLPSSDLTEQWCQSWRMYRP
jgi:hypothetical protein